MQPTSHETSSEKSKPARKGSSEAASSAAASAFAATSSLSLGDDLQSIPPEQLGRRRLVNSYIIPRDSIIPDPDQPRQHFDEIEMLELTASIKERGIKQPLTVRWNQTAQRYMVIDGGRRYEAATRIKLDDLPCWVQEGDKKDVLIDQIVHNWQRASLRPYETADALARLRDQHGLTQKELCKVTGKPKSDISKLLALHDKVDPEVQKMAREDTEGQLTKRHLYNISKLKPDEQKIMANEVQSGSLTAIQTERLVEAQSPKAKPLRTSKQRGISARQRRFKTAKADLLITFRTKNFTHEDMMDVVSSLSEQVREMGSSSNEA